MSVLIVGDMFPESNAWSKQERYILRAIRIQVEEHFANEKNLIINTLYFGPQFNDIWWRRVKQMINNKEQFDNIFWTALVDPLYILPDVIKEIETTLSVKQSFYIGSGFEGKHSFNVAALSCSDDFYDYDVDDIVLQDVKYLFLCYNRKPKAHRINLVEKIYNNRLDSYGLCTLGKNDTNYDVSSGITTSLHLVLQDDPPEKYSTYTGFGGVPFDLLSLGKLSVWQTHFLNIVSETEFNPWDNLFVTEKTWKPIIGLRPFVINGQAKKIYKYLRSNGFRTFNHYFKGIELEDVAEYEVHDSIIEVIRYLTTLDRSDILAMYQDMLPDLKHNRARFFEFAKLEKLKMNNLFV
jgi:hypothetical protein